ncbi:MAG TPA: DUF4349 domain-containing protein [Acidimicrobiia bacterium]
MSQWLSKLTASKTRAGAALLVALLAAGAVVSLVFGGAGTPATQAGKSSAPLPQVTARVPRSGEKSSARADVASPASASGDTAGPATQLPPTPAPVGPRVVKNGSLSLEVKRRQLGGSVGQILTIVGTSGGAVQSSESRDGTATLLLRIPSAKFETTVVSLRKIGKVTGDALKSEEVTAQYVDLEARLRNLRAQEAVMLDLMAQAKSIPDTITVQQQLSGIQGQIEELEGQRRVLDDQTTFATLSVTITEHGAPVASGHRPSDSQLAHSWHQATDAALAVVGGTLVVLGAVLPLALVGAAVGFAGLGIRRRRARPAAAA